METSLTRKAASAALAALLAAGCVGGAAVAAVSVDAQPAHAAQSGTWKQSSGKWWYAYSGGGYAKSGWASIGGKWYLFDKSGWMLTGWQKVSGKWYYLKSSGEMAVGWQKVGKSWYYLKSSGDMATGWQKIGKSWYYLKSSGEMAEGWQKVSGKWYYLAPGSGAMATGWQKVGGDWYYLDSSGAMASSKWVGNYYVGSSGAMEVNTWVGNYYVGDDGKWIPGYEAPDTTVPSPGDETGQTVVLDKESDFKCDVRENSSTITDYSDNALDRVDYDSPVTVVVPNTIQGRPVTHVSLGWGGSPYTTIDLSNCKSLVEMEITSADKVIVGNYNNLERISISNITQPTSLSPLCPKLTSLYVVNAHLQSLNLSGCPNIEYLYCDDNELTTLDLKSCSNLVTLYCGENKLKSLDLRENAKLDYLDCGNNELTEILFGKDARLLHLGCYNNKLTAINPNVVLTNDVSENPNVPTGEIVCFGNNFDQTTKDALYAWRDAGGELDF